MGINKGTVLDLINDVHKSGGFKDYNSYSYLFDQVDMMPESEEDIEPHWIPVTEKLPNIGESVFVTLDTEEVCEMKLWEIIGVAQYWCNPYDGYTYEFDRIIAWMPKLEPYKGVME